jgi:glycosyltransferase involved in cell wall biosynthesis
LLAERLELRWIPGGVDAERFHASSRLRSRPARPLIGTVARLTPERGVERLIAVASLLQQRGLDVRWRVIGQGSARRQLRRLARRAGVEIDWVVTEDVAPELRELDLYLNPVVDESFGLGLLEALASGLPVVSGLTDGARLLTAAGRAGRLVSGGSVSELADALESLLADPDACQTLSQLARAEALAYGWDRAAADYLDLYQTSRREWSASLGSVDSSVL